MTAPTGILFYDPQAKPLSNLGAVQPGCYLLFYFTGTTVPQNVYANGLLTTALSQTPGQAQPSCTADANGRFNPIYMDPKIIYKVQLYSSAGTLLETVDPYVVPATANALKGQTGTGTATISEGSGGSTLSFSWVMSAGGTVCTLQMQGGVIASTGPALGIGFATGAAWPPMASGNSYHTVPGENNSAYASVVVEMSTSQSIICMANPITGPNSWTNTGNKGFPVGFTITYPIAGITEH